MSLSYLVFSPMFNFKNCHEVICENGILLRATELSSLTCIAQKCTHSCAYCNTEHIQIDITQIAAKPQYLPRLLIKLEYSKI